MQWYGHGRHGLGAHEPDRHAHCGPRPGTRRRVAVAGLGVVAALLTAGCSLLDNSPPERIELPPTDELSTVAAPSTSTPRTRGDEGVDTPNRLRAGTIGRVISMAPRADIADYGMGATTRNGSRGNASGYHFSTPDRQLNCSTSLDSRTLVCRALDGDLTGEPTAGTSSTGGGAMACDRSRNLVTLNSEGAGLGLCDAGKDVNLLYRSTVLPYGTTITMSRISCLTDVSGLYCLESRTKSGFLITGSQVAYLDATDPAPKSMVSAADPDDTDTGTTDVTDTAPEPGGDAADNSDTTDDGDPGSTESENSTPGADTTDNGVTSTAPR